MKVDRRNIGDGKVLTGGKLENKDCWGVVNKSKECEMVM